jgi:hypothetical protein
LRLTNSTVDPQTTAIALAVTPVGEIQSLTFERHAFFVEDRPLLVANIPSRGAILAESALAPRAMAPQETAQIVSANGTCRGEMLFDFTLAPGETQTLGWMCPLETAADLEFCRALVIDDLFAEAEKETSGARLRGD